MVEYIIILLNQVFMVEDTSDLKTPETHHS